jgi:hypothetical protein
MHALRLCRAACLPTSEDPTSRSGGAIPLHLPTGIGGRNATARAWRTDRTVKDRTPKAVLR